MWDFKIINAGQQSRAVKEQTLFLWSHLRGDPQYCFPSLQPSSDLSAKTPGKLRMKPPPALVPQVHQSRALLSSGSGPVVVLRPTGLQGELSVW